MSLQSVIHRFAQVAKFFPERPALWARGRHYGYRELSALAQGIRNGLIESGFAAEPRIGLLSGDDACSYASVLAILANGSACVPLDPHDGPDRNSRLIDHAGLNVVLVSGEQESAGHIDYSLPEDVEVMRTRTRDSDSRASASLDVAEIEPDGIAYLFYPRDGEGGAAGEPMRHRQLNRVVEAMLDPADFDFVRDDRFLQSFGLCNDLAPATLFTPLSVGACCYVVEEVGVVAENIVRLLGEQALTVAAMTSGTLAALEPLLGSLTLPALRHSHFCGGAPPQDLIESWSKCVPNARIRNLECCG